MKHLRQVLLLVYKQLSLWAVPSNTHTEDLRDLPQVLGIEPFAKVVIEPCQRGIVLSSGSYVIDIDKQSDLLFGICKEAGVSQTLYEPESLEFAFAE